MKVGAVMKQKGISYLEVAMQIGVSPDTARNWERGKKVPSGKYLRPLARVLGCSVADLFDEPDEASAHD